MHPLKTVLAVIGAGVLAAAAPSAGAEPVKIGRIEIKGSPSEQPDAFAWLMPDRDPTLRELVQAIERAGERSDLEGVLIRLKDAELSLTQVEEIGAAIRTVRDGGKRVRIFAESFGPGELLLGSYADEVIVQSGGDVTMHGVHMEEFFLADALEWIGVKADLIQVGDYKGASEMFVNNAPSPAWEQNITQLLDGLYANMRAVLRANRALDDPALDRALEMAWMATGEEGVRSGLVDAAVDLPGLAGHMGRERGAVSFVSLPVSPASQKADMANPFAIFAMLSKTPAHKPKGPTIAIVNIDGPIVDGESSPGGFLGARTVGSRTVRNALEDILKEDQVKGVIVRVDSPGGSASASEIIWQGIRRVSERKPVWVSIGSMAASGGYYISVAGDRIYANPSSIVGSIGVVGGKISMGGLYDALRVRVVTRSRGPRSAMFDSTRPWTDDERALVRDRMSKVYELFTRRVREGRSGIDLSTTAEGRLFTGRRAVELAMADKIGGLRVALADMSGVLGLDSYDVMHYPGPKALSELFEEAFGGFMKSRAPGAGRLGQELAGVLRAAVGRRGWESIRSSMEAMLQMRDQPVLLVMPRVLIIR